MLSQRTPVSSSCTSAAEGAERVGQFTSPLEEDRKEYKMEKWSRMLDGESYQLNVCHVRGFPANGVQQDVEDAVDQILQRIGAPGLVGRHVPLSHRDGCELEWLSDRHMHDFMRAYEAKDPTYFNCHALRVVADIEAATWHRS